MDNNRVVFLSKSSNLKSTALTEKDLERTGEVVEMLESEHSADVKLVGSAASPGSKNYNDVDLRVFGLFEKRKQVFRSVARLDGVLNVSYEENWPHADSFVNPNARIGLEYGSEDDSTLYDIVLRPDH